VESTWDELYTDRTTPTSGDAERRANDDDQQRLHVTWCSVCSSRSCPNISTAWMEPSSRWVWRTIGGRQDFTYAVHTARRTDDAGGPPLNTTFTTPTTRNQSYCSAGQSMRQYDGNNPLVNRALENKLSQSVTVK